MAAVTAPIDFAFVTSAADAGRLPDSDVEVAVVGRSNVGKSSLLNAVGRRKNLAHVSKTPGRTQLLNCYARGRAPRSSTARATGTPMCPRRPGGRGGA